MVSECIFLCLYIFFSCIRSYTNNINNNVIVATIIILRLVFVVVVLISIITIPLLLRFLLIIIDMVSFVLRNGTALYRWWLW